MAKRTSLPTALLYRQCTILGLGELEDRGRGGGGRGEGRGGDGEKKTAAVYTAGTRPGQGMVGKRVMAVFSRVPLCAFDQTMPRPPFCDELQRQQVKG